MSLTAGQYEAQIATEVSDYDVAVKAAIESQAELDARVDSIRILRTGLTEIYTLGADPCPVCGLIPIGMKCQPGIYEVGCLTDLNEASTASPKDNLRSRGETVEAAVNNWNAGVYYLRPIF